MHRLKLTPDMGSPAEAGYNNRSLACLPCQTQNSCKAMSLPKPIIPFDRLRGLNGYEFILRNLLPDLINNAHHSADPIYYP